MAPTTRSMARKNPAPAVIAPKIESQLNREPAFIPVEQKRSAPAFIAPKKDEEGEELPLLFPKRAELVDYLERVFYYFEHEGGDGSYDLDEGSPVFIVARRHAVTVAEMLNWLSSEKSWYKAGSAMRMSELGPRLRFVAHFPWADGRAFVAVDCDLEDELNAREACLDDGDDEEDADDWKYGERARPCRDGCQCHDCAHNS